MHQKNISKLSTINGLIFSLCILYSPVPYSQLQSSISLFSEFIIWEMNDMPREEMVTQPMQQRELRGMYVHRMIRECHLSDNQGSKILTFCRMIGTAGLLHSYFFSLQRYYINIVCRKKLNENISHTTHFGHQRMSWEAGVTFAGCLTSRRMGPSMPLSRWDCLPSGPPITQVLREEAG